MGPDLHTPIEIKRECEVTMIPRGEMLTLAQGDTVVVTQALGGSFTVRTEMGYLVRIAALDADALGLEGAPEQEAPGEAGPFSLEKVIEKLKTVFDPEIPVNVVDLGLIYVCEAHPLADGGHRVEIKMSMTAPGCGMGDVLKADACRKVQGVAGVTDVDIDIVWEPAWDQSRMSEAAQLQLGML
jgi:probable FeS assembly SUF system protein SufT